MILEELKEKIFDAGIVGAGGAGFPTHAKISKNADTIVLNGAECEPLLRVDRQLLSVYAEEILWTLDNISKLTNAKVIIGVKESYKDAVTTLTQVIKNYEKVELKLLPNIYPAGDEVVLVYETTGRIVPEGAIPLSVGVAVLNVETVLNIYNALENNNPVIEKYVTVTGAVNKPITLKVPIGTRVNELIRMAGDVNFKNYKILCGGPMTGKIVDIGFNITKTTKAIIVLPEDHPVIIKKELNVSIMLKRAMSVCSQCQMCTDLCPRHLLGHSIQPNKIMKSLATGLLINIEDYTRTMLCSECGLCEMYSCHQGLSPRTLIAEVKNKLKANGIKNTHNLTPENINPMRAARMVPMSRLISRLSLNNYVSEAPLALNTLSPDKVKLMLSQHIGVKAASVVEKGQKVEKGQLIADVPEGKLGAKLHASISGTVKDVTSEYITILA